MTMTGNVWRSLGMIGLLAGVSLAGAGCADVNDVFMNPQGQLVEGRFHRATFTTGDVLEYPCRIRKTCREVLVRDDYLRNHYMDLDGKMLELRVLRTNACHDPRSTTFACRTSSDGAALLILQWLEPEG